MKVISLAALLPFGFLAAEAPARKSGIGTAMIPENTRGPVAETITDEQLLAKRAAAEKGAEAKAMPPRPQSFGLLEMSTIIQSGQDFLLLPKGSVLWCPPAFQNRIVTKPSGQMLGWQSFITANRNWVTHFEVTSSQITGKTPIPPEALARFAKGTSIVVATLNGSPVTVIASSP